MTERRAIVTWVWNDPRCHRVYRTEDLRHLADGLARFGVTYQIPLIAFCSNPRPIPGVDVRPIPKTALPMLDVQTVEREGRFPSSFVRLWLFSEEARDVADVVLLTDLDIVVTGDWTPLFEDRPDEDFMGWKPGQLWGSREDRVGGGTWRLRTGTRTDVWEEFVRDPEVARKSARQAGYRGSDQAWLSYRLGPRCPVFRWPHGIYSIRDFNRDSSKRHVRGRVERIPEDARMIHFNGPHAPWDPGMRELHPWLEEYL